MMSDEVSSEKKMEIIPISFDNKRALYRSYMPFVKNGGLFIPTTTDFVFGESIILLITFFGEADKTAMKSKVIWKTPPGAEGGRVVGVGVQFEGEGHAELRKRIETHLSGMISTEDPHTL